VSAGETTVSMVDQLTLADISEPAAVSSVPAPGWWLLAGLMIIIVGAIAYIIIRRLRRQHRLKDTLKALDQLMQQHQRDASSVNLPAEINILLKRQLIQAGHTQVQTLHGKEWLNFLQQQTAARHRQDITNLLNNVYQPYNADAEQDKALHQRAQQWIKSLPC